LQTESPSLSANQKVVLTRGGLLTFISLGSRVKRRFTCDLWVSGKNLRWWLARKRDNHPPTAPNMCCLRCRKCKRISFQIVRQVKIPKRRRSRCDGCSTSSCLGYPRQTAVRCVWQGATECPLKLRTYAANVAITCAGFVLPST